MPICPTCNGERSIFGFSLGSIYDSSVTDSDLPKEKRGRLIKLGCNRCKGTGYISKECVKWIAEGEILKNRRIQKRITMIRAAKLLRMWPSTLSEMERGIIKPDLNISYDTIRVIRQ